LTISSTNRVAGPFTGNGVVVTFPFTFKVFATSDLLVVKTTVTGTAVTLALTTDYSVSLNSDQDGSPGGTVTLNVAPATGETLAITSQVPSTQSVLLTNSGGFYPAIINTALDRLTVLIQQIQTSIRQAIQVPLGEAAITLPSATSRANYLLGFDSSGNPVASVAAGVVGAFTNLSNATFLNALTGASSRSALAKLGDVVSVKDFGAKGDGTTDDTAAFNAAHTAAASINATVYAPGAAGGYKIAGTIVAKASMYGDGPLTTLISTSATANVITCAVQGVTLRDFNITTSVTRTSGAYIVTTGAQFFRVERVDLFNWYNGIVIGGAGVTTVRLSNIIATTNISGGSGVTVSTTSNCVDILVQNIFLVGTGTTAGTQPANGVLITNAGDINLDHVSTVKCGTGLNLTPGTGQIIQLLYCSNSEFDSGAGTGVQFNMTGTGSIQLAKFNNVWACTNANGFVLGATASGTCLRSEFVNCVGSNNTGQGFLINYTGVTDTLLYGGSFSANTNGFYATSGATKFKLRDAVLGATGQFAANSGNGLVLAGSNDIFNVEGCSITGYSVGSLPGTPGQTYWIRGNQGLVTSAQGQSTLASAATSTTVNHGLAFTPRLSDIQITNNSGWGTATQFWVTNPTTTQFTINTAVNPGAGVLVGWDARAGGA
jgi:hypothetical protein